MKQPRLFIVCGYIGVGKTTVAHALGKMMNAPVASVDQVIRKIVKKPSNTGKDQIFNPEELRLCYNVFALLAEYCLSTGTSLILDGGFAKKSQRQLIINVAKKLRKPFHILYLSCPGPLVQKRLFSRFKRGKGVGWKAHLQLKTIYEPFSHPFHAIDSSKDVTQQLKRFLKDRDIC